MHYFVKDKDLNYLSYDIGVLSNNNAGYWTGKDDRITSELTSTGTVLTGNNSNLYNCYLGTSSTSRQTCYQGKLCVEFDVVSVTGANSIRPQLTDGTTKTSTFYLNELGVVAGDHIKIVVENDYVDWYIVNAVNPVKHDTVTFSETTYAIGFRGKYPSVFKFRNFIVYSNLNM